MAYDDLELESNIEVQIEVNSEFEDTSIDLDSPIELVREY